MSDSEYSSSESSDEEKILTTKIKETVVDYVILDDKIREKKEEIKELSNKLKPSSEYIINFLDKQNIDFVNIAGGKLIKSETESKAPLKLDLIKDSIKEKLDKIPAILNSTKVVDEILELLEKKRTVQKRINIRRAFVKTPKKRVAKK